MNFGAEMDFGFGTIASGGGGGGVTAANDGLSLNGATVQLGEPLSQVGAGDAAQLLEDRFIPMNGFSLFFIDSPTFANTTFSVNGGAPVIEMNAVNWVNSFINLNDGQGGGQNVGI